MSEKFSYSRIDTFVQCGFKYKLKYVDKHYIYSGSVATEVGTMIHAAEESIAKILIDNPTAIIDYVPLKNKIIIETMKIQNKYPEAFVELDKAGKTYKEKIDEYLKNGIYRLEKQIKFHSGYKVVAAELPFDFTFAGTTFKGFIDRLIYDEVQDKYIIQDIKTYAVPVDEKTLEDIPLQFVVYTLAVQKLYNIPANKIRCQYDLPFCDCIQNAGLFSLGAKDTNNLEALLKSIANEEFCPNASPLCHWCEFCPTNPNQPEDGKNLCPYYSLWTKEHKTKAVAMEWEGLAKHEMVLKRYLAAQNE